MPFVNTALVPLVTNSGFTMWLYRTTDSRADALTPGYSEPAAARLATGDIIVMLASDSMSFLPVRVGDVVASGLVLDTAEAPFRVQIRGAQVFSVAQTASAVAMTVILGPLAAGLLSNGIVQASATLAGPVAQVAFSISDAGGAVVRGPTLATVTGGNATASLPAPAPGTGYRLRVVSTSDGAVADTSPAFSVTLPFGLLLQAGGALLIEDGSRLLV
ncbi:hypothetical protein HB662_26805 [Roseomonas frigidaquae]|uniref:Uncharacterized protein n=1 Tax=Falsiroseomonas frigidaquae TaxID=487318 RepID=A0ABX1F7Y7_9PROT|nr:hypothetical protein [Falsiroseomonas frigidaquae]NKE48412.1 hypothetical protein [Falsiroseomonas frigidaquae]